MIRINMAATPETIANSSKAIFHHAGDRRVLAIAIWLLVHSVLEERLEEQQGRNNYLGDRIASLDNRSRNREAQDHIAALLQSKKVVESLQSNRAETVYLLDQLCGSCQTGLPQGIAQKGELVCRHRLCPSNARFSTFMRNLEASSYLEKPNLIEIKAATDRNMRVSEFSLAVMLTRAAADEPAGKKPAAIPAASSGAIPTAQVVTR